MYNFKVGQVVCLKSDTSKKGAIISISEDGVYSVFVDNEVQTFYPSQLLDLTETNKATIQFSDFTDFHTYMTAVQIKEPNHSSLFSLNSGKISYIPYQYRPVLKFIKSDEPKILIADSVGVGKTIEAELILKELEARKDVESVAIICPKPLISERKWELELKRFGEEFIPLEGKDLKFCIEDTDMNGDWPARYKRCIIPYSLFDDELLTGTKKGATIKHKGLLSLDPPPKFDLVIVDEAHHIKNPSTSRNKVVNYFVQNSLASVFLTATPIELGSGDLFVLLNSLRPDLFIDRTTFSKMLEPNQFINKAAGVIRNKSQNWQNEAISLLNEAKATSWGIGAFAENPEFLELIDTLKENTITDEERVRLITKIEQQNTFSNIINRTRRRDIGNFTIRKPETVRCKFNNKQQLFYDHLLETEKEVLQTMHGPNVSFMMSMIERQCSSCIYGMIPLLNNIKNRNLSAIYEAFCEADELEVQKIINEITFKFDTLQKEAEELPVDDPKFEALLKTISEKQEMEKNKIIIFSTFRHTLSYLSTKLEKANYRVAVIHGDVPDDERRALRKRFELNKNDKNALDIMLFSEVGCEGLDYQFCDYMVNYDLPWNPMRVEQRIGRIDRNGQKSEAVVIVNMITEGTIEQEIFDRCLSRIGVFENSIGDCEGILGELTEELQNIATTFSLTKEEQAEKIQQLADNKIRFIQENEKLEDEQYSLLGIKINKEDLDKEIKEATNDWTSPKELEFLVKNYLESIGYGQIEITIDKTLHHLRISKELKEKLLIDYKKLGVKSSGINLDWERWLKKGDQYFTISFTPDEKTNNEKCTLLNVQHPLVKQASEIINIKKPRYISFKTENKNIPSGNHYFIIYQWKYIGVTTDTKLITIATSEDIEKEIEYAIMNAVLTDDLLNPDRNKWEELNKHHYKKWDNANNDFVEKTRKIINFRKQSLTTSFRAEKLSIGAILDNTTDEKIKIMKAKQLENCIENYERKIAELNNKIENVDIHFTPLIYGILNVGD